MSSTKQRAIANLCDLVDVMQQADGFADVREALSRGESAAIDGAWGSSCALAAAALVGNEWAGKPRADTSRETKPPRRRHIRRIPDAAAGGQDDREPESQAGPVLLVVLPRISEVDDFAVDLAGFLGRQPEILPAWESLPRDHHATDPVLA